ncbi:hypothetical protein QUA21_03740, partial [Microcoleus sp. Pol1B3]
MPGLAAAAKGVSLAPGKALPSGASLPVLKLNVGDIGVGIGVTGVGGTGSTIGVGIGVTGVGGTGSTIGVGIGVTGVGGTGSTIG